MANIVILRQQLYMNNRLKEIAQNLKNQPTKAKRLEFVQQQVATLNESITQPFCTCLDPKIVLRGLVPEKCKVMESKKQPLWLCFENAEPGNSKYLTIFKDGDDLRQDQLTLQLIAFMDKVWRDDHLVDEELLVFSTFASTEASTRRAWLLTWRRANRQCSRGDRLSVVNEGDGDDHERDFPSPLAVPSICQTALECEDDDDEDKTAAAAAAAAATTTTTTTLPKEEDESSEDEEEVAREMLDRERQRVGTDTKAPPSPSRGLVDASSV